MCLLLWRRVGRGCPARARWPCPPGPRACRLHTGLCAQRGEGAPNFFCPLLGFGALGRPECRVASVPVWAICASASSHAEPEPSPSPPRRAQREPCPLCCSNDASRRRIAATCSAYRCDSLQPCTANNQTYASVFAYITSRSYNCGPTAEMARINRLMMALLARPRRPAAAADRHKDDEGHERSTQLQREGVDADALDSRVA